MRSKFSISLLLVSLLSLSVFCQDIYAEDGTLSPEQISTSELASTIVQLSSNMQNNLNEAQKKLETMSQVSVEMQSKLLVLSQRLDDESKSAQTMQKELQSLQLNLQKEQTLLQKSRTKNRFLYIGLTASGFILGAIVGGFTMAIHN